MANCIHSRKKQKDKREGEIICIYMMLVMLCCSILICKMKGYNLSTSEVSVTL